MKLKNVCVTVAALVLAVSMTACGSSSSTAASTSEAASAQSETSASSAVAEENSASSEAASEAASSEAAVTGRYQSWDWFGTARRRKNSPTALLPSGDTQVQDKVSESEASFSVPR